MSVNEVMSHACNRLGADRNSIIIMQSPWMGDDPSQKVNHIQTNLYKSL